MDYLAILRGSLLVSMANEPHREKTGFLHVRKQRRETDQRLCFRFTDSTF